MLRILLIILVALAVIIGLMKLTGSKSETAVQASDVAVSSAGESGEGAADALIEGADAARDTIIESSDSAGEVVEPQDSESAPEEGVNADTENVDSAPSTPAEDTESAPN